MSSWRNPCALSLELCTQHLFRGCQFSATSLLLTSGEWQQCLNFSIRSGLQPSLSPWYQTLSPTLKSALHQDVQYGSRNHNRNKRQHKRNRLESGLLRKFVCNQPLTDRGPFHRISWIRPPSTLVVNVEPLSHWPGSMCSQPRSLESGFRSVLFLWRTFINYVTHCERLPRYEISRRSVSFTLDWWWGSECRAHAEKKKTYNVRTQQASGMSCTKHNNRIAWHSIWRLPSHYTIIPASQSQ